MCLLPCGALIRPLQACVELSGYVQELNTHYSLYTALVRALQHHEAAAAAAAAPSARGEAGGGAAAAATGARGAEGGAAAEGTAPAAGAAGAAGGAWSEEEVLVGRMLQRDFERYGVHLSGSQRDRMTHLVHRGQALGMQFTHNVLDPAQLGSLELRGGLAGERRRHAISGCWGALRSLVQRPGRAALVSWFEVAPSQLSCPRLVRLPPTQPASCPRPPPPQRPRPACRTTYRSGCARWRRRAAAARCRGWPVWRTPQCCSRCCAALGTRGCAAPPSRPATDSRPPTWLCWTPWWRWVRVCLLRQHSGLHSTHPQQRWCIGVMHLGMHTSACSSLAASLPALLSLSMPACLPTFPAGAARGGPPDGVRLVQRIPAGQLQPGFPSRRRRRLPAPLRRRHCAQVRGGGG